MRAARSGASGRCRPGRAGGRRSRGSGCPSRRRGRGRRGGGTGSGRCCAARRANREAGVERQRAGVGRQHVQGPAGDVGGVRAEGLKQQLELRAHGAAGGGRRFGGVAGGAGGQGSQVLVLVRVQFERAGEGVGDGRAGAGLLAALEPGVVVDAHAASAATSSRRRPGVRRTPVPGAKPTSAGVTWLRRARRKRPSSVPPLSAGCSGGMPPVCLGRNTRRGGRGGPCRTPAGGSPEEPPCRPVD